LPIQTKDIDGKAPQIYMHMHTHTHSRLEGGSLAAELTFFDHELVAAVLEALQVADWSDLLSAVLCSKPVSRRK